MILYSGDDDYYFIHTSPLSSVIAATEREVRGNIRDREKKRTLYHQFSNIS